MERPPLDPAHWLFRLSPEDWLAAAVHEYDASVAALAEKQQRRSVASARRAAGMALNAVLVLAPDESWGRSYMDHLRALAADARLPEGLRHAALQLEQAPLDGPRLIRLGGGMDEGIAAAARVILEWCATRVDALLRSP